LELQLVPVLECVKLQITVISGRLQR